MSATANQSSFPTGLNELFEALLAEAPEARAPYLAQLDTTQSNVLSQRLQAWEAFSRQLDEPCNLADFAPTDFAASNQQLGPYRLLSRLATGGMSEVWLAERSDDLFHKTVAIKTVWTNNSHGELARLFERECKFLAQFEHPNIPRLIDAGQTESGQPYAMMEYVEGQSLTEYCQSHALPLAERLKLFADVCAAVQYAHQLLVIHRDLKPANILVTNESVVKLIDFGIAKFLPLNESATPKLVTLLNFLTPEYASPEQLRNRTVSTASDVYSLGVILYELLTDRRPFAHPNRDPAEIVHTLETQTPAPPSQINQRWRRELRGDLDAITGKALRADATKRYGTVAELSADLERRQSGEAVLAQQGSWRYHAGKFLRRRKAGVTIAALLALALLAGVWLLVREGRQARAQVRRQQEIIYAADLHRAGEDWENGNHVRMQEALTKYLPPTVTTDLRGFEWHYLQRLTRYVGRSYPSDFGTYCVAYSPDNRWLAVTSEWDIVIFDIQSGLQKYVLRGHTQEAHAMVFFDDGRRLASIAADERLKIWDFAAEKELASYSVAGIEDLWNIELSPDNRWLAVHTNDSRTRVLEAATGKILHQRIRHGVWAYGFSFSPDGRTLATTTDDNHDVVLWNARDGRRTAEFRGHADTVYSSIFSHDGRRLVSTGDDGIIRLWDVATRQPLQTLRGHDGAVYTATFSPDDQYLASLGVDRATKIWHLGTGAELVTLRGLTGEPYDLQFSPDGKQLATAALGKLIRSWNFSPQNTASMIPLPSGQATSSALSPDQHWLAVGDAHGAVKWWDAETGQLGQTVNTSAGAVESLCFSADGQRFATVGADRIPRLWATASRDLLFTLPALKATVIFTAFIKNDRQLLTVAHDGTAQVWDIATRKLLWQQNVAPVGITAVALTPDGHSLAIGHEKGEIRLWEIGSTRGLATWQAHNSVLRAVTFAPDGQSLVTAGDDLAVRRWSVSNQQPLNHYEGLKEPVYALACSPDGQRLATAGKDRTVRLWNLTTGDELLALKEHHAPIYQLVFTRDGLTLISASEDETIRFWRAANLR